MRKATFTVRTSEHPDAMRTLTLLPALLLASITNAQWAAPSANTPVRVAGGVEAVTPLAAPGPDGSTYICWFEQAGAGYVLRMQRLDVDGVPLWDPAGLLVSDAPQSTAIFRYDLASDAAGNAIVAFQDVRSGPLDAVACKVTPDGALPWGNGLLLPTPGSTGLAPSIGVLTDDRLVFAWTTDETPGTVAYRVLAPDGTPDPIGTQVVAVAERTLSRPKVVPTSDGGFWLQYVEQTGNFLSPGTLMAMRSTASLEMGEAVALSTSTVAGFYFPQPVPDGHDGMYVAINTGNPANPNLSEVALLRLRADGSRWSNAGTPVELGTTTQRYTMTATPALVNDDDGLMMVYRRTDLNQNQGGLAVQRLDTAGNRLLGDAAVQLLPLSSSLPGPFANAAVGDGIVCAQMQGGFGSQTLSAFRLALNGGLVDPPAEIPLCTVTSGKDDPTLVPFRNGQAVAVWTDERSGSGIYAQNLQVQGSTGLAEAQPSPLRVLGGDVPALLFPNGTDHAGTLRLLSADGRLLHHRILPAQAPGAQWALPMHHLAPGAYLLVLDLPGARHSERLVKP